MQLVGRGRNMNGHVVVRMGMLALAWVSNGKAACPKKIKKKNQKLKENIQME
jgi:hypothetical protein